MRQISFCKNTRATCLILAVALSWWVQPIEVLAADNLDIVVHSIEGTPVVGKMAYQVKVILTVYDAENNALDYLDITNFRVSEDSQPVIIQSVDRADNNQLNVVLLLDTSGSMMGLNIDYAKAAASDFVSALGSRDQVAIKRFDEQVVNVSGFTNNRGELLSRINSVNATLGSGTCLYDAISEATQLSSTLPSGERAIVLLTDGVDETRTGDPCSKSSLDGVISAASTGAAHTPVYVIGLGNRIDGQGLEHLASATGGRYLYSLDSSRLSIMFRLLSKQLKSRYVLTYETTGTPGAHKLAVEVDLSGDKNSVMRDFALPELPVNVSISKPEENQIIFGKINVNASVTSGGGQVEALILKIDQSEVSRDDSEPYDFEVAAQPGLHQIEVVAVGAGDLLLAVDTVNVSVQVEPTATKESSPQIAPTAQIGRASCRERVYVQV
jgi:VWFA-related protein